MKWGPAIEGRFETRDREGPSDVQGYIIQSEPIGPEGPYTIEIYLEYYQPWLKQNGWQGYADYGGAGRALMIGWKKGEKYFHILEERSDQGVWVTTIRHN